MRGDNHVSRRSGQTGAQMQDIHVSRVDYIRVDHVRVSLQNSGLILESRLKGHIFCLIFNFCTLIL